MYKVFYQLIFTKETFYSVFQENVGLVSSIFAIYLRIRCSTLYRQMVDLEIG